MTLKFKLEKKEIIYVSFDCLNMHDVGPTLSMYSTSIQLSLGQHFDNFNFIHSDEHKKKKCTKRLKLITRNKSLGVKYGHVTEAEKKVIVSAIGLSQGHWFKCPKGE